MFGVVIFWQGKGRLFAHSERFFRHSRILKELDIKFWQGNILLKYEPPL